MYCYNATFKLSKPEVKCKCNFCNAELNSFQKGYFK